MEILLNKICSKFFVKNPNLECSFGVFAKYPNVGLMSKVLSKMQISVKKIQILVKIRDFGQKSRIVLVKSPNLGLKYKF